jgi:hypothetical protein
VNSVRDILEAIRALPRPDRLRLVEQLREELGSAPQEGSEDDRQAVIDALRASAGAWSDDSHPDLRTREDVVKFVRELRDGFERRL